MDPYLERPELWPDVHNSLIAAIREFLAPQLRPKYYAAIEERTYRLSEESGLQFVARPDVAVIGPVSRQRPGPQPLGEGGVAVLEPPTDRVAEGGIYQVQVPLLDEVTETYLEIRAAGDGRLITLMELLSPSNKMEGSLGREQFLYKRSLILSGMTHYIEVDLLRMGEPMPIEPPVRADYSILVSRWNQRPGSLLYAFNMRQPIPTFPIPLQPGDKEPDLPLNQILHELYDKAGYDLRIDYARPADPPLHGEDAAWAQGVVGEGDRDREGR